MASIYISIKGWYEWIQGFDVYALYPLHIFTSLSFLASGLKVAGKLPFLWECLTQSSYKALNVGN